jgi:hypothetical protein
MAITITNQGDIEEVEKDELISTEPINDGVMTPNNPIEVTPVNPLELKAQDMGNPLEQELVRPAIEAEQEYQNQVFETRAKNRQTTDRISLDISKWKTDKADDVKEMMLVKGVIKTEFDRDSDSVSTYQFNRAMASKSLFGEEINDDKQFVAKLKERAEVQRDTDDYRKAFAKSSILKVLTLGKFSDVSEETASHVGSKYVPDSRTRKVFDRIQSNIEKELSSKGVEMLAGVFEGFKAKDRAGFMDDTRSMWKVLDKDQRDYAARTLGFMARNLKSQKERDDFFEYLGESMRGVASIGRSVGNVIERSDAFLRNNSSDAKREEHTRIVANIEQQYERGHMSKETYDKRMERAGRASREIYSLKEDAENAQTKVLENDFVEQVIRSYENEYDPTEFYTKDKTVFGVIERGLHSAPAAMSTTFVAMIPYAGLPLVSGIMFDQAKNDLNQSMFDQGINLEESTKATDKYSFMIMIPNTFFERAGAKGFTGGKFSPISWVEKKAFKKISSNLFTKALIRNAGETVTELTQGIWENVVKDYAASMDERFPDIKFSGEGGVFDGYAYTILETAVAVAPMSGISAGLVKTSEIAGIVEQMDELVIEASGYDLEAARELVKAKGTLGEDAAAQAFRKNYDPNSEKSRLAVDSLNIKINEHKVAVDELTNLGMLPSFKMNEEGKVEVYDEYEGELIGTADNHLEAQPIIENYLKEKEVSADNFTDYVMSMLGSADEQRREKKSQGYSERYNLRLGDKLTVEDAIKSMPQHEARILEEVALYEKQHGGNGKITLAVNGFSQTEYEDNQRIVTNNLFAGSSPLTVIHESTHGAFRRALDSGAMNQEEAIRFFRMADGQIGDKGQKFLKSTEDSDVSFTELDEAVSEFMESEVLRTRQGVASTFTSVLREGLKDAVTNDADAKIIGKFKAFAKAVGASFRVALTRAAYMNRAIKKGLIDEKDVDEFRAKLQQTSGQEEFNREVEQEYAELTKDQEQALKDFQPTEDVPFSLGWNPMEYQRVMPRDLFNEAKTLSMHKKLVEDFNQGKLPEGFEIQLNEESLDIGLSEDGELFLQDFEISFDGEPITVTVPYNSGKETKYPMEFTAEGIDVWGVPVYEQDGTFDSEFVEAFGDNLSTPDESINLNGTWDEANNFMTQLGIVGLMEVDGKLSDDFKFDLNELEKGFQLEDDGGSYRSENLDASINGEVVDFYMSFSDGKLKFSHKDQVGDVLSGSRGMSEEFKSLVGRDTSASFSISPEQDASYMQAVESGDVAAQQAMVDEAAKAAGFDSDFYHGTDDEINTFNPEKGSRGNRNESGFVGFVTKKEDAASVYGQAIKVAIKHDNTLSLDDADLAIKEYAKDNGYNQEREDDGDGSSWRLPSVNDPDDSFEGEYSDELVPSWEFNEALIAKSKEVGADSFVTWDGSGDALTLAFLNPNQIKSAEPVTYDASGEVIPLSQRFDQGKDSISFSIGMVEARTEGGAQWSQPILRISQKEMLAQGADGHLRQAFKAQIPLDKIMGHEPTPANYYEEDGKYKAGKEITQPIEVLWDKDQGGFMLYGGNHRVAQAEANGDKMITAFVEVPMNKPSFSLSETNIADELIRNATGRGKSPEARVMIMNDLAARVEALKRDKDIMKRAFGKDYVQKANPDKRTKKSIQKESAMIEALRREELEDQVYAENYILEAEELTKLKEQPIHEYLSSPSSPLKGQLMSVSEAMKQGKYDPKNHGDYNGAGGASKTLFGGTLMPDQAAQELADLGLIKDPYVDTMWEALEKEQFSVTDRKEDLAKAKKKLKDARALAKSEAKEWADATIKEQNKIHNPLATVRRSLAMLDAILMALPVELRGKVGGHTQLSKIGTNEKRLEFFEKRLEKADVVIEQWQKKEITKQIDKLFSRAGLDVTAKGVKMKKTGKGVPKSSLPAEFTDRAVVIAKLSKLSQEEVDTRITNIAEALDKTDKQVEVDLIGFGNIAGQSAASLTSFFENLNSVVKTGKTIKEFKDAEFKEQLDEIKAIMNKDITGGAGRMLSSKAKLKAKKQKKFKALSAFHRKNVAWEWLINGLARENKDAGTLDSETHNRLARMVHVATHSEKRMNAGLQEEYREFLSYIFGGLKGTKLTDAISEMMEEVQTKVMRVDYLGNGAFSMKKAKASNIQAVIEGRADSEKLGFNSAEIENAKIEYERLKEKAGGKLDGSRIINYESPNVGQSDALILSQSQAIYLTMMFKQDGIRESMIHEGYTEETMKQMEDFLSDESLQVRDWMAQQYKDNHAVVNEVFKEQNGVSLPIIDNYSPVRRLTDGSANDLEIDSHGGTAMSTNPNFTISRVKNFAEVDQKADALSVYMQHMVQTNHYVTWAKPTKILRSVFSDKTVKKNIEDYAGGSLLSIINERVQWFADGGNRKAMHMATLDKMRAAHTYGSLAFNWQVGVKQLTSLPAFAFDMGFGDFAKYQTQFLKNPIDNAKAMMGTDYVRTRFKEGYERDVMEGLKQEGGKILKGLQMGMMFGKVGDIMPVIIGGWMAKQRSYDRAIAEGLSESEAEPRSIIDFEMTVDRAQQAGDLKDLSSFQGGGSFFKLFTMYKTSPRQYYANVYESMLDAKAGKTGAGKEFARRLMIGQIVLPLTFQFVSDLLKMPFEDDDEELEGSDYLRAMLMGPLNGLFIAGDFAELTFSGIADAKIWSETFTIMDGATKASYGMQDFWDGNFVEGIDNVARGVGKTLPGGFTYYEIARKQSDQYFGKVEFDKD